MKTKTSTPKSFFTDAEVDYLNSLAFSKKKKKK